MMGHEITVRYESQKNQQQGWWYLYYHTPVGIEPFLTQRHTPKRYRRLYDALKWAARKRPAYAVNVEVRCYSGVLRQNQTSKEPAPG